MCTRWIVELSPQAGPNSPFPTAKFFLRSFAKGGERGYGRKNKGTLLRSSKGTTPSPPSAESWRQYRSGMYLWNIRSWLLCRSGSLSSHLPLVNGDKSVQLGELEDRSLCCAGSGHFCPLESAWLCRVSTGHGARGRPLILPRCRWKSAGAAGTCRSQECASSPCSFPHLCPGNAVVCPL